MIMSFCKAHNTFNNTQHCATCTAYLTKAGTYFLEVSFTALTMTRLPFNALYSVLATSF